MYLDVTGVLRHGFHPGDRYDPPVNLMPDVLRERRDFPTMAVVLTPREVAAGMLRDAGIGRLRAWVVARRLDRAGLLVRNTERMFPWGI